MLTYGKAARGFHHEETGGGCTALIREHDGRTYVLTSSDDPSAPRTGGAAVLGIYSGTYSEDGGLGDSIDYHDVDAPEELSALLDEIGL
jgi:hypothetical protein